MPEPSGEPLVFEETLVINVRHGRYRNQFFKPPESLYENQYLIEKKNKQTVVRVFWHPDEAHRLPKCIQFQAVEPDEIITAVGFSVSRDDLSPHDRANQNCGVPCFRLRNNLPHKEALVENSGHQRENGEGYHFAVWLRDGKKVCKIDPQIYNEGKLPPPGGGRKKRGFRHHLRRLLAWLS